MTDGFLLIDKEAGITSNDVLTRLKRKLATGHGSMVRQAHHVAGSRHTAGGQAPCPTTKMGHTGTLDPFATGLLVVAIGEAVKFISYLNEEPKVYEVTLKLGEKTDTGDLTGQVIETKPWLSVLSLRGPSGRSNPEGPTGLLRSARNDIQSVFDDLIGEMDQIPPMFSAKKFKGKKLYELAREGIEVERKPVTITITSLEVIIPSPLRSKQETSARRQKANCALFPNARSATELAEGQGEGGPVSVISFRVFCSRGTYVRSLGETIAEKLGTVGHLVSLRRLRAGSFDVKNGVAVDGLWDLGSVLVPIEKALSHLPTVELSPEEEAKILKGQPIPRSLSGAGEAPISLLRNGHLLGIGEFRTNQLWPKRLVAK